MLSDIFSFVQPDENPYHLGSSLGFDCSNLETLEQYGTCKEFWYAGHAELMLTFTAGWLIRHDGTDGEWKELVTIAVAVARLGIGTIEDASWRDMAATLLSAADAWVAGEISLDTLVELSDAVKAVYDNDEEAPEALDGAWSAAVLAKHIPQPFHGEDATYAAGAALIRERFPAPEGSGWQVF